MIRKHVQRIQRNKHMREMFIYGLVGISALIMQDAIFLIGPKFGIYPTIAMIIGNLVGMFISYYGHSKFTFRKSSYSKREFIKFAITSIIGLIINASGVRIITKVLMLNHIWGLLPTFITPIITFLISKFWAFRVKS
ncbi:MAG: GtrA family protein [Burkholderiales bacterium]|nr:GtrA family protein [Burkholderiales bacterium]